jgi:hypothetical protein
MVGSASQLSLQDDGEKYESSALWKRRFIAKPIYDDDERYDIDMDTFIIDSLDTFVRSMINYSDITKEMLKKEYLKQLQIMLCNKENYNQCTVDNDISEISADECDKNEKMIDKTSANIYVLRDT